MIGPQAQVAIPEMKGFLKSPHERLGAAAFDAMRQFGEAAVPCLIEATHDDEKRVAWQARQALADIGAPAVPALVKMMTNAKQAVVRDAAAYMLAEIGAEGKAAVPALLTLLKSSDPQAQ